MTVFSYDNPGNDNITTDTKQPTEPTGYQKREWGGKESKERGNCYVSFSLVQFFLPRMDLNLSSFLLWDLAYCHIRVPAHKQHQHAGHNLLQKQMKSKNILLSKQVGCVCARACLHVWFMQKSCQNILVHQKSNLHTFLGHCRGWLTWHIAIQKECWLKHFRSLGCGSMR